MDAFTRFVIAKYAELQHHLPLNEDNVDDDDQVSAAERLQSFCDHGFFDSNTELWSTDYQQPHHDEMRFTRHAVSPSRHQPPSCEG